MYACLGVVPGKLKMTPNMQTQRCIPNRWPLKETEGWRGERLALSFGFYFSLFIVSLGTASFNSCDSGSKKEIAITHTHTHGTSAVLLTTHLLFYG